MNVNFASKAVAGTALGLSIGSGVLALANGGLRNLGIGVAPRNDCPEDHGVSRYEAALQGKIAELETEVKLRDANTYTDQKLLDVYRYVDGKIGCVEAQINAQAVYNATNTATLNCISGQVAQLMALTKVVIPADGICPAVMPAYNSWTAPTTPTTTG